MTAMDSGETMLAIQCAKFGTPDVMIPTVVPRPIPGPNEVLVKVYAVGVRPADCKIRSGKFPILPELPYTPGHEAAGVVESWGSGVSKFKKGDRVFLATGQQFLQAWFPVPALDCVGGVYAQYVCCSAKEILPLLDSLTYAQGCCLGGNYRTAHRAVISNANVKKGDLVLVHGASGSVGSAACQFALDRGCTVIGTAGTPTGMDMLKKMGVHYQLCHRSKDYMDELPKLTGRSPNIIIEMCANINLVADLKAVEHAGTIVLVGSAGTCEINPIMVITKQLKIMGCQHPRKREDIDQRNDEIVAAMMRGSLKPVIDRYFSLKDAAAAHIALLGKKASRGKIVLLPWDEKCRT